ncbi:MAG TPA: hypothetical protein DCY07_00640 [Rhodospirillaceae bacterium]|nr:hypothetical protein [Rhodospirillaceae bacterium]
MELHYLVIIGLIVNLTGSLAYVRDTLLGRSQPNRVTFFLWALAPFIATVAALSQGVTWAALAIFSSGICPFLIFLASLNNRHAKWELGKFDWICGALSVAALVLWGITKNANIAIVFAILSDGAASLPTLKKCWTHPQSETIWAYLTGLFSASMGLVVANNTTFQEIAFPIYLVLVCAALAGFILIGHWRKAQHANAI